MHSAPPSGGGSLSLNLQWLIDRCPRQFVEQGTWPNERELLREGAKAGFELDDFFYQPTSRDFLWRRDHDGVIVSVAGLAHATIAAPLLADLLRFVRLCVLIYFGEGDDAPKVTADLLRSSLGMDEITIDRLFKLFSSTEYFLTAGGSSQSPTQWEYFISDSSENSSPRPTSRTTSEHEARSSSRCPFRLPLYNSTSLPLESPLRLPQMSCFQTWPRGLSITSHPHQ